MKGPLSDSSGVRPLGATLLETRDRPTFLRALMPALAAFLVGVTLSLGVFFILRTRHVERQRIATRARAAEISGALQLGLDVPLEVLVSIRSLFEASADVSRDEFRAFTAAPLQRHPGIYALEWLPRVPGSERAAWEAAARADGVEGFQFKDDLGGGRMVRAPDRPFHMPIYYMEPPNEIALGFDLMSEPHRFAPAEEAARSGETVATRRIRLVEDDPSVYSIAVFHPIYRIPEPSTAEERLDALRGVAAEVFRVRPMVERALRTVDLGESDLILLDRSAPLDVQLLYETTGGLHRRSSGSTSPNAAIDFPFADRTWSLQVVAGQEGKRAAVAWGALTAGVLLSSLVSLGIGATTTIARLRRQVRSVMKLGQYTLVERIGGGGMGVVYRASHAMLRRPTAIKLLAPGAGGEAQLARFEREVQMTSELTHPNTIAIYDYGRTDRGVLYYAMEYVDGITLDELINRFGPVPTARAIHILKQACGSLAEAHDAGLIHRDVKPANLMLCEQGGIYDFVKVLDFGLVKQSEVDSDLSRPDTVMGTPLYMSPEAIRTPDKVDARSDIYALGAVGYFLVTGSPVFEGDNLIDVCRGHLYEEPIPPSQRSELAVPGGYEDLLLRCLAKDPGKRPHSAARLLADLEELESSVSGAWSQTDARAWWRLHEPTHGTGSDGGRTAEGRGESADLDAIVRG